MPETIHLDAEDAKIVTLARSAQARAGAQEGAAVRDTEGRTYTGATVSLPSLTLTALQAAVAAAVASGARDVEAAAVASGPNSVEAASVDAASLAALRELGPTALVLVADQRGTVRDVLRAAR
ncbi:MAG: cytidine deaminase [Pseudonocardiales bacterium]|nr:cytidine deaminase [Pseudonocardiales bacterium]